MNLSGFTIYKILGAFTQSINKLMLANTITAYEIRSYTSKFLRRPNQKSKAASALQNTVIQEPLNWIGITKVA